MVPLVVGRELHGGGSEFQLKELPSILLGCALFDQWNEYNLRARKIDGSQKTHSYDS